MMWGKALFSSRFLDDSWRIIPASKCLISMISKYPPKYTGLVLFKYKWPVTHPPGKLS